MSFTVVQPEANARGTILKPRANKKFVDGAEVKPKRGESPYWWSEVRKVETDQPLPELYKTLQKIEQNNSDHVIVAEHVHTYEGAQKWFRLQAGPYLEKDIQRNWIQLDFDHGPTGCNSLPLSQRLDVALAGLPLAFSSCECVAQLSSKAFLCSYPDYMGLRVYFALKTPYTNAQLRQMLKGLPFVDTSIFSNARRHYTSVLDEGDTIRNQVGPTIEYRLGRKLDLQELEQDKSYVAKREQEKSFEIATRNFQKFSPESEQFEDLLRLAKDGYFDRIERHHAHWKILKKAEWTNQNGSAVIDAILDAGSGDGTILGNRADREKLQSQLQEIQKEHLEHFGYKLSDQKFDVILPDPKSEDLKGKELPELKETIHRLLHDHKKVNMIGRSPHGSAKTTALVPLLSEIVEEYLGRPARVLYICTLRSIIRGTAKELMYECYLSEDGTVQKPIIASADKLAVCIRSIAHVENPVDILIRDEAESIALWSQWESHGVSNIRDYSALNEIATHPRCIMNVLLDADAAELTYAQLERNLTTEQDVSVLLENTGSWITALEQKMHWCRKPRQVLNQLYDDAVYEGKRCFVHVDFDDKETDPKLTALVNAYNDLAGREIAKAFWSGSPLEEKNKLTDIPNTYIPELFAQGIQIIIVSPIIVSGWRYKADPHFDSTYGIYTQTTQSAPHIIQRTQRVTHVREHYLYVAPCSSWTNYHSLQQDLEEELEYSALEHTVKLRQHEASAKELIAKTKTKKQKMMDNVKLHTILYWEEFGGKHEFWEFDENSRPELELLGEIIKEAKEAELLRTATTILADEERLEALLTRFTEYDVATETWGAMHKPTTPEVILEMLKVLQDSAITHETAQSICHLLNCSESEWMQWDVSGAPWKPLPLPLIASLGIGQPNTTYRHLGLILHDLEQQIGKCLLTFLVGIDKEPIVLKTSELDSKLYNGIVNRYYNLLKTNLPDLFGNGIKAHDKVIANLFKKVLQCDVKVSKPKPKAVAELKRKLVAHYQDTGHLPKGDPKNRTLQKRAEALLAEKLRNQFELDDLEQDYFDNTGKLMVINTPQYRTIERQSLLRIMQLKRVGGEGNDNRRL